MNFKFQIGHAIPFAKGKSLPNFKFDWKIGLFLLVLATGIFLRVYHFSDWLFFKLDQARDAFLISQASEKGIGYLPLLGPRAGGTSLLLGPAYYYFQYLASKIAGSISPPAFAYPDLVFGILAIPMLYFFLKRYFSRDWSLALSGLYAVCFFAVEYSRFAWNPNPLPFFSLLYFFSFLKIFDKENKNSYFWAAFAAFSLAIASQLHFLAFLALPAITIIFLVLRRKEVGKYITKKKIAIFIVIFLSVYASWILNDFKTHWDNTHEFTKAVYLKIFSATLLEDVLMGLASIAHSWVLILTGYILKDSQRWASIPVWLLLIIPTICIAYRLFRGENKPDRKNFLLIVLLWLLVYIGIDVPIGRQLHPRFFMGVIVLPFVFVGLLFQYFQTKLGRYYKYITGFVLAIFFFGNIAGNLLWFKEMKNAQTGTLKGNPKRTFIFKNEDGIVLWHEKQAADYMISECPGKPIYFAAPIIYIKPIEYILRLDGALMVNDNSGAGENSCYFAFVDEGSDNFKGLKESIRQNYSSTEEKKFGVAKVVRLIPNSPDASRKGIYEVQDMDTEGTALRLYWKNLSEGGNL